MSDATGILWEGTTLPVGAIVGRFGTALLDCADTDLYLNGYTYSQVKRRTLVVRSGPARGEKVVLTGYANGVLWWKPLLIGQPEPGDHFVIL